MAPVLVQSWMLQAQHSKYQSSAFKFVIELCGVDNDDNNEWNQGTYTGAVEANEGRDYVMSTKANSSMRTMIAEHLVQVVFY